MPARYSILGAPVDAVSLPAALDVVAGALRPNARPVTIFDINPEKVCIARSRPRLLRALRRATLVLADGVGISLAARLLCRTRLARLAGIDFMEAVCAAAASRGWRVFLFGARPGVAARAAERLRVRFPGLVVAGTADGYAPDRDAVIDTINGSGADILFVALGSPAQEQWLSLHRAGLHPGVCQAVGGAFDVLSGRLVRAPRLLRNAGLEWAWRLLLEPARAHRQFRLLRFIYGVLACKVARTGRQASSREPEFTPQESSPDVVCRSLLLASALHEVQSALNATGVQAASFKGPSLAWGVYPHPALRPASDLDILIRRFDLARAVEALRALGFSPASENPLRLLEPYRQIELVRGPVAVELHWALMPAGHPFSGDAAPFLSHLCEVSVAGRPAATLAPEILLPYLCAHASKHAWDSFKWVRDVALLAARPLDWSRVWDLARRERCTRSLSVGLTLARDFTDAELPPEATPRDPLAAALARSVSWDSPAPRGRQIAFQFRCAEGLCRKVRLAAALLRPTPADGREAGIIARSRRVLGACLRPVHNR